MPYLLKLITKSFGSAVILRRGTTNSRLAGGGSAIYHYHAYSMRMTHITIKRSIILILLAMHRIPIGFELAFSVRARWRFGALHYYTLHRAGFALQTQCTSISLLQWLIFIFGPWVRFLLYKFCLVKQQIPGRLRGSIVQIGKTTSQASADLSPRVFRLV